MSLCVKTCPQSARHSDVERLKKKIRVCFILFFSSRVSCVPGCLSPACYVAKDGFQLLILLYLSAESHHPQCMWVSGLGTEPRVSCIWASTLPAEPHPQPAEASFITGERCHPSCPCDALEAMLLICPSPAALALHAWTNSICSAPQSQALRPQGLATFWIYHLLFSYSLLNAGSFLLNQKSFSRKPSPHCLNHPLRPL